MVAGDAGNDEALTTAEAPTTAELPAAGNYYEVLYKESLRARFFPESKVTGCIAPFDVVFVSGSQVHRSSHWAYVQAANFQGWIRSVRDTGEHILQKKEDGATEFAAAREMPVVVEMRYVALCRVLVRADIGKDSRQLGHFHAGDAVRVLQVSDDCRRVRVEGSDFAGWVSVVRENGDPFFQALTCYKCLCDVGLHSMQDTSSDNCGRLLQEEVVEVIGVGLDSWLQVDGTSAKGWVRTTTASGKVNLQKLTQKCVAVEENIGEKDVRLVGLWQYGKKDPKAYLVSLTREGRLRWEGPNKVFGTLSGILHPDDSRHDEQETERLACTCFQAELLSPQGTFGGHIRLRYIADRGVLVSNFRSFASGRLLNWGSDIVAQRAGMLDPSGIREADEHEKKVKEFKAMLDQLAVAQGVLNKSWRDCM
eukprot:gnl/TRDRNA2_/TRDRNA2_140454_c1_seq1.p1 gnl/TRDRNA2_/TRDRNA2_140454_c1~~gnl/TRDRNA2_/TRDRNA2_140454_c1_seq1.p1  ORF type:complete len:490 (-),score=79.99 gnl/TRDRNA2_/TRDRNA2_140454_c1_seq1:86-1351(-)